VLLAACSLVCAAAHVLRLAAGPDLISCVHPDQDQSPSYLVSGDLHSTWCLVTVLLLYFFGMAAALWWVALAAGFYLAAGRKWSREAVSDVAGYFHAAAWALPAVQTAAVLALRRFSGDELTGLCYVDSAAAGSLVGFVLAPLGFYLVAGLVLVGARRQPPAREAHAQGNQLCSVSLTPATFLFLFFSRPRSEGWPHHGRTFSIYPCPLSF